MMYHHTSLHAAARKKGEARELTFFYGARLETFSKIVTFGSWNRVFYVGRSGWHSYVHISVEKSYFHKFLRPRQDIWASGGKKIY